MKLYLGLLTGMFLKYFLYQDSYLKLKYLGTYHMDFSIANYSFKLDLTNKQLVEWSILDTFDMLSPLYDKPQRISTLKRFFIENNIEIIYLGKGVNGYAAMGEKIK